jgi:hypothetical protein
LILLGLLDLALLYHMDKVVKSPQDHRVYEGFYIFFYIISHSSYTAKIF